MQCWYMAGTTTECSLRRGVHIWEDKNAVLMYVGRSWNQCSLWRMSAFGRLKNAVCATGTTRYMFKRCPPIGGACKWMYTRCG